MANILNSYYLAFDMYSFYNKSITNRTSNSLRNNKQKYK